jgi:dihydrofolate reductase
MALDILDEMFITHVNHTYGADTFFPEIDESKWNVETVFEQEADEKHAVSFWVKKYTKK